MAQRAAEVGAARAEFGDLLPGEKPLSETLIGFVDSFADLQECMRWLSEDRGREVLAIDSETTGLDRYAPGAKVRLFQLGTANEAWVVNAEKYPGIVQEILETYRSTPFVGHNIPYDYAFFATVWPGIKLPWSRTRDTMIAQRIYDNLAPAGLKPMSERAWGRGATAGQRMLDATFENTGTHWGTVSMGAPAYSIYSGQDVLLTARWDKRLEDVHSGTYKRSFDLEMEVRRVCTAMELRGMRVDMEYCKNKLREMTEYIEATESYCLETYGVKIGSTQQLGKWFADNGAHLTKRTETGMPAMDKEVMEDLTVQGFELADLALKARKAKKITSTYLENFIRFGESNGNVIHHTINTIEARTGRMSITDPAMQTLPRRDKVVRPCIVPFEGEVLLSADSDQIEFRSVSSFAMDEKLIARFAQADATGPDVFTQIGREVFDDPEMQKADPRRDAMKTMIYSRLYGASVSKQALSAGIPVARMQEISDAFDAAYPSISRYQQDTIRRLERMRHAGQRPYVTTHTGRRLYLDPLRIYTTALSYQIQGGCSEVLKQSIVNLDYAGLGDAMLCPVHDELIFSLPEEDAQDARQTIAECMTNTDFAIPLPAECSAPMTRWLKS